MAALWRDLGKAGFIGINVPEEFGGGGAGMAELALVAEESAAAGCPLLTLLVSSAIGVEILRRHGIREQQQSGSAGSPTAATKVVFAITEPDAGSELAPPHHHRAARDGDDYLISGQKYYISGVDEAAAIITVTRTGTDPVTGKAQLSLFLVPVDAPGLTCHQLEVAAQIPDRQYTVFYDDVRVPASALIGGRGQGLAAAVRRAEPRAHLRRGDRRRHRPVRAWPPPAPTPATARCGASRSAPTRPSPTRWPRRRSRSNWPR